ncbi:MAG TPA: YoaK family protein, partial [Acidobacteriaceae bacterium]|nr:YoaK family protein [Acidobacteriaceae bacterium]
MTTAATPSNRIVSRVPEQAFNSLGVAMLLTAAGAFLDAFSYFGHGRVFANVMTGNLVLSAVSFVHGDWTRVARLLLPVASFLAGASTGAMLRSSAQRRMITNPQAVALTIEIAILAGIGSLPAGFSSAAIVSGISFLIAVRSCFFSHVEAWTYASTMPTGNLRQFGEAVVQSLSGNPKSKRQATVFALVTLSFFVGALAGGVATDILHNRAIWIGALFLLAALVCGLVDKPFPVSNVASSVCVIGILALFPGASARAQSLQDAAPACPSASTILPVTTYDE